MLRHFPGLEAAAEDVASDSFWKSETRKPQLNTTAWGRARGIRNGGVPRALMDMEMADRDLRPRGSVPRLWDRRRELPGVKRVRTVDWSRVAVAWISNAPQGPMC